MKQRILMILLLLCVGITSGFAKKKNYHDVIAQYDIEAESVGQQGTYVVHVWVYGDKKTPDSALAMAAVHGVIFRGVAGKQGVAGQRPMASSITVEQQHADYFEAFFDGPYASFANVMVGTNERVKTAKGYKIGATVQVMKDELRKDLEQAGIVRSLGSGF